MRNAHTNTHVGHTMKLWVDSINNNKIENGVVTEKDQLEIDEIRVGVKGDFGTLTLGDVENACDIIIEFELIKQNISIYVCEMSS